MRIKGFFGILVFLLLVLGGGLLFLSSRLNLIYFYIGEGLVLFILCYLPFFYRKIVKPLNSIGSGMELLREQDFSSRLSPVGQYEADRIVNVFNRMMEQLKNERLRLREQNNFLDLLIKASPMGVILTTLDEDLSELNPMAQKMLGVRQEDVLGKKMNEIKNGSLVKLIEYLEKYNQITTIQGVEITGKSEAQVRRYLKTLCNIGILEKSKSTKGNIYVKRS
jgi:nitrogen fixation/metabolism regulation signal transduction histidine kinase